MVVRMSGSITLTFPADAATLAAILTALGVSLPPAAAPLPESAPHAPANPPAPTYTAAIANTVSPPSDGSFIDHTGLAVIDAAGAAVIADPRNASAKFIAAVRLIVSKPDLTEDELLATVDASTLAGHKAASTKRVQRVLGGRRGAVLYRIQNGKVVMADPTRKSLAAYFGI